MKTLPKQWWLALALSPGVSLAAAPADTQIFLQKVHAINQAEIMTGGLARDRASSAQVKSFAKKMIDDHTDADKKVTDLATKLGVPMDLNAKDLPAPVKAMVIKQKDEALALTNAKGATFDKNYTASMHQGHEEALGLLKDGQATLKDSEVKALATALIPTVEGHAALARRLDAQSH